MAEKRKSVSTNEKLLKDLTRYGDRKQYLSDILYYGSDRTVEQYKKMRVHPMCWLGLNFLKLGLADVPFVLECDEDEDKRLITEKMLKKVWRRMMRDAFEKLDYGFKPMEIRWEVGLLKYLNKNEVKKSFTGHLLKQPRSLDPETVEIIVVPGIGTFEGFKQDNDNSRVCLAKDRKALVFTHNAESGNFYGMSALEPVYPFWYDANLNRQFHMRWLERKGTGFFKGFYPDGEQEVDGEVKPNQEIMLEMLDTIMEGNAIALPSDRDPGTGELMWDILFMSDEDKTDPFLNRANYIDEMILKGLIIPEKALTQGEVGARSSIEAFQDMFVQRKQDILDDTVDVIDKYLLPHFVEVNFGTEMEMHISAGRLDDNSKEVAGKIVEKLLEKGEAKVDLQWVVDKTGVPLEEQEPPEPEIPDFMKKKMEGEEDEGDVETKEDEQANTTGKGKDEKEIKKEEKEKVKKMADYGNHWRAFDQLEQQYNLADLDSNLDRLEGEFMASMAEELNRQYERVKRYLDKNYNADGEAAKVAKNIEIKSTPIKKVFRDFMKSVYDHSYSTVKGGVEGVYKFAATDTPSQYISFRVDVTGEKFAKEFEDALKYQVNDDLSSQVSKPELFDNLNIVVTKFLTGRLRKNAETELGFILGKGVEDYVKWNNAAVKKGLLDEMKEVTRVRYSAILDSDVCPYCREIDGIVCLINSGIYKRYGTPAHYHCRCIWLPVTRDDVRNPRIGGTGVTLNNGGTPLTIADVQGGATFYIDGEKRKLGKAMLDHRTF